MASIGKIFLKCLAFVYFAVVGVFLFGYWKITDFAQNVYDFFYNILGIYSMSIPILFALFGTISWLYAGGIAGTDKELPDNEDLSPPTKRKKTNKVKKQARYSKKGKNKNRNELDNIIFRTQPSEKEDNFTLYFADRLSIKELDERRTEGNDEKLGSDFSTYFGQGKKSIVLPSRPIRLQGFRGYFLSHHPKAKEEAGSLYVVPKTPLPEISPDRNINIHLSQQNNSFDQQSEEKPAINHQSLENFGFQMSERIEKKIVDERQDEQKISNKTNTAEQKSGVWRLPDDSLLEKKNIEVQEEPRKDHILEEVLESFGVSAKVINVTVGPIITRYELHPAPGVKISKIVNLADDIALAMASKDVRIEAPIPGKAAIGIEIPNVYPRPVSFYEVLSSPEFVETGSKLRVAIGKDIANSPITAELDKLPHLLVAGATGAGKSVFIKSLICSLLYHATPDDVKFLLIDPKMVEMNQYNGIPHLLAAVVTDPKKATAALKHIVSEMENRYELFAANGVRDIDSYNKAQENREKSLPYIVVIIDELADLMMVAANDIEQSICRLAQMARAAGIHLVIATQRPSVNVITGVIKANVPSRISFAVSSQIDSRTILDGSGAEKLLGRGDMLFNPLGLNKPVRVLGCFIDDHEEKNLISHWKAQGNPVYAIQEDALVLEQANEMANEEYDDKFTDAAQIVIATGIASVSFLQRKLKVGYSRAARLMDMLEEGGIVGGYDGNKPRQILMNMEQFQNAFLD